MHSELEQVVSLPANADLSTKRYYIVDINSSGKVVTQSSAGGRAVGVLNNKPSAADEAAAVQIGGVAKVILGGTVTAGDNVQSDANGKGITAASGDSVLGIALTSGVSGDIVNVLITSRHILA